MVSNASDDFPDPLSPVTTVRVLRGISTLMFLRLCCRAPRTEILVIAIIRRGSCPFRNVARLAELLESGNAQLCSVSYSLTARSVNAVRFEWFGLKGL